MKSDQLEGFRPHSGASLRWEMGCISVSKTILGLGWALTGPREKLVLC